MPVAVPAATSTIVVDFLPQLMLQAAHDLNNHLATILGRSEIALLHDDPLRWRHGLEETLEAGNQARRLVSDVQRVVNWHEVAPDPVPFADVAATALRLASRALRRHGAELVLANLETAPRVEQPAVVAVTLWLLLREGVERAGRCEGRAWHLLSRRAVDGWSIELAAPGFEWPIDADGTLARIARAVETLGATLHAHGEVVEIRFEA